MGFTIRPNRAENNGAFSPGDVAPAGQQPTRPTPSIRSPLPRHQAMHVTPSRCVSAHGELQRVAPICRIVENSGADRVRAEFESASNSTTIARCRQSPSKFSSNSANTPRSTQNPDTFNSAKLPTRIRSGTRNWREPVANIFRWNSCSWLDSCEGCQEPTR